MDWLVYNTHAGFVLRGSAVIVASPQRPEIPDSCPLDLKKLIVDCWQEDRTVTISLFTSEAPGFMACATIAEATGVSRDSETFAT